MEFYHDPVLDSPSKNSYIGSYYQPPDMILPPSRVHEPPAFPLTNTNREIVTPQWCRTTPEAGSKAVIAALKTLQEKIRRLELERKQAEQNVKQFSQAAHSYESSTAVPKQPPHSSKESDSSRKKAELLGQLQSAEARCQLLEKQLDYMRKMVQSAEKDKNYLTEKQASLQRQWLQNTPEAHSQLEKLEKLERECLKLNRTQSVAGRKIELLEQKLLKEEHERKLVQEKADELQRELESNIRLCPSVLDEVKTKKKKKPKTSRRSSSVKQQATAAPGVPKAKRLPFVAGMSTSPSHSVNANMQSVLHMMKHHHPQLCERVRSVHRSGCAARRGLHKSLSSLSPASPSQGPGSGPGAPSLGSLSDLLLALQDELGQMSFEHQELVRQIDEARQLEHREDLERELELLVKRMEEKGAQITKLRKHQETVHHLTQSQPQNAPRRRATSQDSQAKRGAGVRAPAPSPVKMASRQEGGRKAGVCQENLKLLRETQKLRTSLTKDDITWES